MMLPPVIQTYSSYMTGATPTGLPRKPSRAPTSNEPPRKPDWLLITVSVLFLLTLLIAWFINRPDL